MIKGNVVAPETLNQYGYCCGNPLTLVDKDGKFPIAAAVVVVLGLAVYEIIQNPDQYIEKYDEQGQELLNRYVYEDGTSYVIENVDSWSEYMKWTRSSYEQAQLTQEIFIEMLDNMRKYPEYYGCVEN